MESYDASKGALSLRRTAGHVSETLTGQGGSAHKRSRKELGAGSMLQAALTSDPQPPGLPPGPPALSPLSRPTRCFAALGATWFPRRWAWGTPLCPAPLSATYHLLPSGHRQPPLAVGTGPVGPSPPVALLCLPVRSLLTLAELPAIFGPGAAHRLGAVEDFAACTSFLHTAVLFSAALATGWLGPSHCTIFCRRGQRQLLQPRAWFHHFLRPRALSGASTDWALVGQAHGGSRWLGSWPFRLQAHGGSRWLGSWPFRLLRRLRGGAAP